MEKQDFKIRFSLSTLFHSNTLGPESRHINKILNVSYMCKGGAEGGGQQRTSK